MNEMQETFLY